MYGAALSILYYLPVNVTLRKNVIRNNKTFTFIYFLCTFSKVNVRFSSTSGEPVRPSPFVYKFVAVSYFMKLELQLETNKLIKETA